DHEVKRPRSNTTISSSSRSRRRRACAAALIPPASEPTTSNLSRGLFTLMRTRSGAGARQVRDPPERGLGVGDDLVHQVAGGNELVDRADTLSRRIALAIAVDRGVLVASEVQGVVLERH